MTQCEDCTNLGSGGSGVWFKWEETYDAFELSTATLPTTFPDFVIVEVQAVVPCDAFSSYGCQSNEAN